MNSVRGGPRETNEVGSSSPSMAAKTTEAGPSGRACKTADDGSKFACPFYRLLPMRHIDCVNLRLTRIRDVKQHLYRRHTQTTFYCPLCYQSFTSPHSRDGHIRSLYCKRRHPSAVDGISEKARRRLSVRVDRDLPPDKQWYTIWDILFPGMPKPTTPYLGSVIDEIFGMLRDFWRQEHTRIAVDLFSTTCAPRGNHQMIETLVTEIFDKVQERFQQQAGNLSVVEEDLSSYSDGTQISSGQSSLVLSPPPARFDQIIPQGSHEYLGLEQDIPHMVDTMPLACQSWSFPGNITDSPAHYSDLRDVDLSETLDWNNEVNPNLGSFYLWAN
ncbi:hypothetical protein QQS21_000125 [Conoideocrella luteorostrata]|uniref:C2H2-type domain-containing protein n=1 Tax=Conoideocrella luteorostrata TaxID=1105319 RepID=A0AAJ0G319_9HYPO|nr:hypothetical protein QQS21_000125 [Conoideocrella luteorostrata]